MPLHWELDYLVTGYLLHPKNLYENCMSEKYILYKAGRYTKWGRLLGDTVLSNTNVFFAFSTESQSWVFSITVILLTVLFLTKITWLEINRCFSYLFIFIRNAYNHNYSYRFLLRSSVDMTQWEAYIDFLQCSKHT